MLKSLFPKTVASVLSSITKNVADLNDIATAESAKAGEKFQKAAELQNEASKHREEVDRALRVAQRLGELIS